MNKLLYILSFALLLGVLVLEKEDVEQKVAPNVTAYNFDFKSQLFESKYFPIINSAPEVLIDEEESPSKANIFLECLFTKNTIAYTPAISIRPRKKTHSYNTIFFMTDTSPPVS
jgi:hypothetical protein